MAEEMAAKNDVLLFKNASDMLAAVKAGVIHVDVAMLCTPTHFHAPQALECIAQGINVFVEKPLAGDAASAKTIVDAAHKADVILWTGHHRRHNAYLREVRSLHIYV